MEEVADAVVITCDVEAHTPTDIALQVVGVLSQSNEYDTARALRMSESLWVPGINGQSLLSVITILIPAFFESESKSDGMPSFSVCAL